LEPDFSLEKFMKEQVEDEIIPAVLGGFLRGDKAAMSQYCGEAATAATVAAITERQAAGMTMDPNILAIEDVDIISAKVVDKQGAMILARFMAQEIDCMYDKDGKVVKGADDQVTAVHYAVVLEQEYSEEDEEVQWKVKEFAVLGNVPYI
jgi:import inner membrane translocase subunit TIM44